MHSYAQTNVQLYNQLRSEGYSKAERVRVREAYCFGMSLFTGLFLPSGRTFIDHLVGTASILASLHAPIEIVIAGLIHAAYLHGDFGRPAGITEAKRKQVRDAVGEKVEEYVARYDGFILSPQTTALLHDTLDGLSPMDRDVLLMRLANELEHQLDLGGLYYVRGEAAQKWYQEHIEDYGAVLADMAEKLGYPSLSVGLAAVLREISSVDLPVEPCIRNNHTTAYLIIPRSYSQRFWVKFYRKLLYAYRSISRRINWVCAKSAKLTRKFLRTAT
jgi:(p)ppGpp synthase/HD superfamily hydrolase